MIFGGAEGGTRGWGLPAGRASHVDRVTEAVQGCNDTEARCTPWAWGSQVPGF